MKYLLTIWDDNSHYERTEIFSTEGNPWTYYFSKLQKSWHSDVKIYALTLIPNLH